MPSKMLLRKFWAIAFLLCVILPLKAQIAHWSIPPLYERIYKSPSAEVLLATRADTTFLFSLEGHLRSSTIGYVHPFCEGRAVVTHKEKDEILGFVNNDGTYVSIDEPSTVAHGYPFFSEGFLLVKRGNMYQFVDRKGNDKFIPYYDAYPFNQGQAVCYSYANPRKQRNPYYFSIDHQGIPLPFSIKKKSVDVRDIAFLSNFNSEGEGIAIVKHRLFQYKRGEVQLHPLLMSKGNGKSQPSIADDFVRVVTYPNDSTLFFQATTSKAGFILFEFDKMLKPRTFTTTTGVVRFPEPVISVVHPHSQLKLTTSNDGKIGIVFGEQEMLPPQFDEVQPIVGCRAIARIGDRWGVLEIDTTQSVRLSMNDGNDIGFRHQRFFSTLRIDLPTFISTEDAFVTADPLSDLSIDMTSKNGHDTRDGNFLQYKCVLKMPRRLSPDTITAITYPLQLHYDNLVSPVLNLTIHGWRVVYLNVDEINDSETNFSEGIYSFAIRISEDKLVGDDDYPYDVRLVTDSIGYELDKISQTRYIARLLSLPEGTHTIFVVIQEKGCPPTFFPYDVTYEKGTATRNSRNRNDKVTIKKQKRIIRPL